MTKINKTINKGNIINHKEKTSEVRINKFISEMGFCSRREADKFVEQGRVTINDVKALTGSKVKPSDTVKLDGKLLQNREELVYIAFNKPVGITCTTEHKIKGNIVDYINHEKRIFPIGRLDKDSEGLILLTNDGDIVNKILRAGNNHDKEYIVTVDKPLTAEFLENMSKGVRILNTITKPCIIKKEDKYTFRIILTQGLNRQIRRMCEALGFTVTKLVRLRIMNINLKNLPIGKWRDLTSDELITLNKLITNSIKTEDASKNY
ncbi:23S rRNA pseudouridine(2604) synthase RluF [Candidatus Clostridium radicumherbarum]|uniref:Pseudouridine synthase n=1 Tax=Candidatus Clostridium radicumherbarum TaxID=3381662 RepID=A0ABW8TTX6_9CLOT